jgi:hypothetical protein
MNHKEDAIQSSFIVWFNLQYPKLSRFLFHIPNGEIRPRRQNKKGQWYCPSGARLKRLGAKRGVADIFIMIASKACHGLYIEFKSDIGKQSPEQKYFQETCELSGYKYGIAKSLEEAMDIVNSYV